MAPSGLEMASQKRFSATLQLEKLRIMNQLQKDALHFLATKLATMQQSLNAITAHEKKLLEEKEVELADMKMLETKLKNLTEPYMTDLDIELLLSLPQGYRKVSVILLSAEHRWRNAREHVIAQWSEYTSLREKLGEVQSLDQQFKDFASVRKEQQTLDVSSVA